jgi:hypothetical protein
MSLAQLIPHAGRQQIRLLRTISLESQHATAVSQTAYGLQMPRVVLTQTLKPNILLVTFSAVRVKTLTYQSCPDTKPGKFRFVVSHPCDRKKSQGRARGIL